MVFYWEHFLFPRGPTSHTKNHQNEFQRGRAQWELSPTTGVVQRWSLRHSSARHTLSHATSSQPTAIPTPDDTPVSTVSSPYLPHFLEQLWLQWQYLFPSLIWIHCLFRDVSSNSNNYTFFSKQEPHQSYRARHKKSFQNNLLVCLCLCWLNPVPVCSHQLCLFFEREGNVVGGFSIGAPGTGSETRVTSAIAEPLSGRRSPAKTTNRMILQLDIEAS